MITDPTSIRPERLLDRASRTRISTSESRRPLIASGARHIVRALLERMESDQLSIDERIVNRADQTTSFGPGIEGTRAPAMAARLTVHDHRAYTAVVREGAIGFGRGYIEGWWTSDDPVAVVQVIVRNMAPIDNARNRLHSLTGWATDRVRSWLPRHTRDRNREDISAHYDIGNEFFALFLDDTMTYSSGVFPHPGASLREASLHKYDVLLAKLGVDSSHRLLEIGTGWGGLALRAVETIGCDVTTTTISSEQLREARLRVDAAGQHDRITLLETDWRDLTGEYDRLISIEMIEAVDWRDYDAFFSRIEARLEPTGLAGLQAICLPDHRYQRAKNTEDFIRRFVFPNGFLPSVGAITKSVSRSTHMQIVDVEDISAHYAETLRRWRNQFDDRLDEVKRLGLDDRFCRLWRFYLAYCEAGFRERHCTAIQIVLAGASWRGRLGAEAVSNGLHPIPALAP